MSLVQLLRNTSVRELVRALERDGFVRQPSKGSGRMYRHPDGRKDLIHYHHSSDTLPLGTLGNVLRGTEWAEEDARNLGLIT